MKVLLIEDDACDVMAVQRALPPGWELVTVKTLVEGIETVAREHPDIAVLDLTLPDSHDCRESLDAFRTAWPDVPTIVLTGRVDEGMARICGESGGMYVLKQSGPEQLVQSLSCVMGRASRERSIRADRETLREKLLATVEETKRLGAT